LKKKIQVLGFRVSSASFTGEFFGFREFTSKRSTGRDEKGNRGCVMGKSVGTGKRMVNPQLVNLRVL